MSNPSKLHLEGQRFGKLTVVKEWHPKLGGKGFRRAYTFYWCRCDCGTKRVIRCGKSLREYVRIGLNPTCGCIIPNFKHGMSKSVEYRTWQAMRSRCQVFDDPEKMHPNYAGRGITVCDRWLNPDNGFVNFFMDMGKRPKGMSIDRIDVNGNYEPGNCRWATSLEQTHNRRCSPQNSPENIAKMLAELEAEPVLI